MPTAIRATNHPKLQWLIKTPLSAAWRRHLEVAAGVVLTGAAVVALSTTMRPDMSKIAARRGDVGLMSSPLPPGVTLASAREEAPLPSMSAEFYSAVSAGDVTAMSKHFRKGMPLDGLLSVAAHTGKKAAVAWLLEHGLRATDPNGSASLITGDEFPEITKLLLARGAEEPTLEAAAQGNAPNAVMRILAKHPNRAHMEAALAAAASATAGTGANKRLIITKLLELRTDPNRSNAGSTPLAGAVEACDEDRSTPTISADCMGIVDLLIERGAQLTGDELGSALSLEDGAKRATLVEKFLSMKIENGVTANALARATHVEPADLERVLTKKVDWTWHDGEDDAALPVMAAVKRGDRDLVRAFLDAGAPVDAHYKDTTCALAEAIDNSANNPEQARIVELLVARGANVNRRFADGRTPLFAAAEQGDLRVINFLLDRGARVNDVVLDDTARDAAEQHGNLAAARVLHAHGGHRSPPRPPSL